MPALRSWAEYRGRKKESRRWPTALALLAIGLATLTPRPDQAEMVARTPPWCIVCGDLGAVDVLLNVALFVPLGAARRLRGDRTMRVAALSLLVAAAVELLQSVIPGRDPTLSDILTNTAGGAAGAAVAGWSRHLASPAPRAAGLLATGWAVVWLAQTGATAGLIRPALPFSWYWGQLAPDLPQFEQFQGRVAFAAVDSQRIRMGRLLGTAEIRQLLLSGAALRATTTPGASTQALAPIVSIFDERQREIVLLGRWGDDLVYRLRTRAFDARLRPPGIRLPGAFAGADTLVGVSGRFDPATGSFAVALRGSGGSRQRAVPLDAQWGWSLLLPFPYAHGAESGWLTALWVGGWMLPLGFWSRRYRRAALAGAAAVGVLGLAAIPVVSGLSPASAAAWAAAAAGILAGSVVAERRGRQPRSARSAASP